MHDSAVGSPVSHMTRAFLLGDATAATLLPRSGRPAQTLGGVVYMSRSSVNFGTVKLGKSKSRVVELTDTAKKKTATAVTFAGGSPESSQRHGHGR